MAKSTKETTPERIDVIQHTTVAELEALRDKCEDVFMAIDTVDATAMQYAVANLAAAFAWSITAAQKKPKK